MQNKKLIILIVILLFCGFCFVMLLAGLGGAWWYTSRERISTPVSPIYAPEITRVVETTQSADEIPPTATSLPPTESPTTVPATAEPTPNIDFNGIRFYLDLQLAQGVLPELVPAALGNAEEAFPGSVHPEYTQFTLQGYVLSGTFHDPRLYIYPLNEYRAIDRSVDENADLLLHLLTNRPSNVTQLPFLPLWNAASMIQTKLSFLDFKNGSGLRYLTQFGQDVAPINNQALFYTYQGITADQRWYVAAILPVAHPSLPANAAVAGWDIADPTSYFAQIEAQLNAETDATFTPSLTLLDALIASLRVW
ncbi:MAG: hypothetical protein Kow0088_24190 [Anaerolineales bacterium]